MADKYISKFSGEQIDSNIEKVIGGLTDDRNKGYFIGVDELLNKFPNGDIRLKGGEFAFAKTIDNLEFFLVKDYATSSNATSVQWLSIGI